MTPATVGLAAVGATAQLAAAVLDQNGQTMAGVSVMWSSGDRLVAVVDGSGLVTAVGNGEATVTATAGSASGSAAVAVAQRVAEVRVSPDSVTLVARGDTVRLAAEALDANGHAVANAEFAWSSGDTLVAVVDGSGLVTTVGIGAVEIAATSSGASGRAVLTVVAPEPTVVAVTPDTVALTAIGETAQLVAEVSDQLGRVMASASLSWSSADTTVAAVDPAGLVTAIGGGATTIAATAGQVSGTAVVTVMQSVGSVVVSPAADTVTLGDTLRLAAEALDANGHAVANAEFAWSSSDASVASVDGSGLVTGRAEGAGTITAMAGDARGTSEISVVNPDRAALVALYEATDGPNWVTNGNWLTDAPLGEWDGVSVSFPGRVVSLYLEVNNLKGAIPPEIGDLSGLEKVFLYGNALTGSIPPELGDLERLEWLELFDNDLTGPIPPELGSLANLRQLHLFDNDLTGPIPPELGDLTNLERLTLGSNELTGPIPPELGELTRLTHLALNNNKLTGEVPRWLLDLSALERLWLDGNAGLCVSDDAELRAWLLQLGGGVVPCPVPGVRLLPTALLREDGNGLSLALPNDLRTPSAVTVSDPSVVDASVADGWLKLSPRGIGSADVKILQTGGGDTAVAHVDVREAVGTFGIDVFVEEPVPLSYAEAMVEAADWWSHILDGTEWPDREAGCPTWNPFEGKVKAVADELLVATRIEERENNIAGYASGCFFPVGEGREVPALDPGGGYVVMGGLPNQGLARHEIGHLLGLVSWRSEQGLGTSDCRFFTGPQAVEAFRAGGGDPGLPGVPIETGCRSHWHEDIVGYELMGPFGGWDANAISLGALVDAGYTVDLSKALPWPWRAGSAAQVAGDRSVRDVVLAEPRVFIERRPRKPPP